MIVDHKEMKTFLIMKIITVFIVKNYDSFNYLLELTIIRILGEEFHGQLRLILRIKLTTTESDMPYILSRRQYPIRLCFAMTVNKSQGQSLKTVGVDLRTSAFTHGQLYVALSRVTSAQGVTVLLSKNGDGKTNNVVYPEVLLRPPQA